MGLAWIMVRTVGAETQQLPILFDWPMENETQLEVEDGLEKMNKIFKRRFIRRLHI